MGLMTYLFGRKDPIADWGALEDFIDAQAAYLINRTMYEYARARAGLAAEKLLREPEFLAAIEAARWTAFPIGVGNIAELVEGELRPHAGERRQELLAALIATTNAVQSRYALPAGFADTFWDEAKASVETRLRLAALGPPKPAIEVPIASFPELFALVPIHPTLREVDFNLLRNQVRSVMCRFVDEFRRRANVVALVAALPTPASAP